MEHVSTKSSSLDFYRLCVHPTVNCVFGLPLSRKQVDAPPSPQLLSYTNPTTAKAATREIHQNEIDRTKALLDNNRDKYWFKLMETLATTAFTNTQPKSCFHNLKIIGCFCFLQMAGAPANQHFKEQSACGLIEKNEKITIPPPQYLRQFLAQDQAVNYRKTVLFIRKSLTTCTTRIKHNNITNHLAKDYWNDLTTFKIESNGLYCILVNGYYAAYNFYHQSNPFQGVGNMEQFILQVLIRKMLESVNIEEKDLCDTLIEACCSHATFNIDFKKLKNQRKLYNYLDKNENELVKVKGNYINFMVCVCISLHKTLQSY